MNIWKDGRLSSHISLWKIFLKRIRDRMCWSFLVFSVFFFLKLFFSIHWMLLSKFFFINQSIYVIIIIITLNYTAQHMGIRSLFTTLLWRTLLYFPLLKSWNKSSIWYLVNKFSQQRRKGVKQTSHERLHKISGLKQSTSTKSCPNLKF